LIHPHPAFAPYRAEIERLGLRDAMPDLARLNALAASRTLVNARGLPLRFSAPDCALSAREYESCILQAGVVPTRTDNWHDLMNALVWLRYPSFKAALNAAHVAAIADEPGTLRGRRRDALTVLDESGIWVRCDDPALLHLLESRQWSALFWTQRARATAAMRFVVVGHALLEKLLAPYPAMTGKCLVTASHAAAEAALDGVVAPGALAPLPVLGIPGWDAANACAAYYENTAVFRRAPPEYRPR
jgi:hypothetical protein